MTDLLGDRTTMEAVTLHVDDLAGMSAYYREAVGLVTLAEQGRSEVLGRAGRPVIVLQHTPGLPRPQGRAAGLVHTPTEEHTTEIKSRN